MLYPKSNKYRSVYNLNGIWNFNIVEENFIPLKPLEKFQKMAVPASYNDIVTERKVRDHVGKVVYETYFSIPLDGNKIYRLRIGATSHKCDVYLNGKLIGHGINGFYPIDLLLEDLLEENRLSVVIDNRLTFQTFPTGRVLNGKQISQHDFYNFTGIHRDVLIYSMNQEHIEDIKIKTVIDGDYSKILVNVDANCEVLLKVKDKEGQVVSTGKPGLLNISKPKLWSTEEPYLYTLVVESKNDKYEEKFGIRKIEVNGNQFLLNDKPVYFKGFGMHEDFFIIGKGNNSAVNIRNFELLKWINANSFRTSHYPYSEEIMDLADEYGFLVIDEVPAVGMNWWKDNFTPDRINQDSLSIHKELVRQLIARDKNHPCVVMLSVANEAGTHEEASREYFRGVIDYARQITDLPITTAEFTKFDEVCMIADMLDIICINRYYGWYTDHSDLSVVCSQMKEELGKWYNEYQKPIIVTEFGADTIEGLHACPSETFSEEFQKEYIEENCIAFDQCDFCIGEHVWNFADFKTKQGLTRIRGNRKGVFTKERQPKIAAHYLRERWQNK